MIKLNFLTLLILLPIFATNLSVTLETIEQTTKNENDTISHEHDIIDGNSQATALIITPNIHDARRRWRRDDKKKQQLPSLSSSKSVKKDLLSSTSGQRFFTTITKKPVEKKNGWGFIRRLVPSSRETIKERMEKLNEHIFRLAFEVLRSENQVQINKQKEVLKLAIYYKRVLAVLREKLKEAREEKEALIDVKTKLMKLREKTQAQTKIIAKADEKVTLLRDTKRKTKASIDKLIDLAQMNKEFIFADHINELNNENRGLHLLLEDWEKEIPYQYDRTQMKIWVEKHSTKHKLYEQAKANVRAKSEVTKFLNLLLIDAAFDFEARKKCLETAFEVQFRNIAAIAITQKMELKEIRENVCTPLSEEFHKGLIFEFNPSIASHFNDENDDWPKLADLPKGAFGKDFFRDIAIAFNPYSARNAKTHQEELDEESDKYKWEMLNAKSKEERQKAMECVKATTFIQMFTDKMYSEETAEHMNKTRETVVDMKQQLKKSSSRKYRDRRRKRSDSDSSDEVKKKNTTDDDEGEGEDEDEDDDDDAEEKVEAQEATHDDDDDDDDDDDNDDDEDNDDDDQLLPQASPARSSASSVAPSHRSMGSTQRKMQSAARSDAGSVAPSRQSSVKTPSRSSTSSPARSSASSVAPSHRSRKIELRQPTARSDAGSVAPSRQSSTRMLQRSATRSPHSSNNDYEHPLIELDEPPRRQQRPQSEQNEHLHRSQSKARMSRSESSRHTYSSRGEGSYEEDMQIAKEKYDTAKKEQKRQQEAHKLSLEMLRKSYDRMCNSKGTRAADRTPLRDFYDYYNDMEARVKKSNNAFILDILNKLKVAAEEELKKSGHRVVGQRENKSTNYRKEIESLNEQLRQKVLIQFATGPVKSFMKTMAILSKQMTAAELRMPHFRWFPACNVHADERFINRNGTGQFPPEDSINEALKNMKIDENNDYMEFKTKILTEKDEFQLRLTAKEGSGTGTLSRSSSARRQRSSSARGDGPTLSRSVSMSSNASSARGMNGGNKSGGRRRSNAGK
ncbi:hypothetical protein niasHT_024621 [Heterodera trifolii]|uniref:Uncharacterized protein n=1 Tax=Heterodera trifolii TaxID=157864 RepID=A0ABD2K7K9_9BILA